MVFRKMRFRGTISRLNLQGHWTKLRRTCFAKRRRNRHRRNDYLILNIFIRFGDIRRRTSKSSEIGPNFACFSPLKFFWGALPKILDGIIKFGLLLTIVQNFTPVAPRISEISRCNKKNICSKTEVLPKTIVFGRTNNGREGMQTIGNVTRISGMITALLCAIGTTTRVASWIRSTVSGWSTSSHTSRRKYSTWLHAQRPTCSLTDRLWRHHRDVITVWRYRRLEKQGAAGRNILVGRVM